MEFSITYVYRADNGMEYSTPTHSGRVTIDTKGGEREAAKLAIEQAYQTHGNISHVCVMNIKPIIEGN